MSFDMTGKFRVGSIVLNPKALHWGPGKILLAQDKTLTIYFRDFPESSPGDAVKKLNLDHVNLVLAGAQSDPWLDNIPPLKDGKLHLSKPRMTIEQGVAYFLRYFPLAFRDPGYLGDLHSGERNYKWNAHVEFVKSFGNGQGEHLLRCGAVGELCTRTRHALNINLLHLQERLAFRDGLDGSALTVPFFETFFRLWNTNPVDRHSFEAYVEAMHSLPNDGEKRLVTWPNATLLPYLADPSRFMFLKPEVTKQAADGLAFDLLYDAAPNWHTYEKLLTMSAILMERLRPLGAIDWIDVQSFIWVIAEY